MKFLTRSVFFIAIVSPFFAFAQSQNTDTNRAYMDALFQQMHDNITWGARTTNGIQLGMAMFLKDSDRANKFGTFTYLYDETNFWLGIYPPKGYRLSLSLQDEKGRDIEKTEEGESISKSVGWVARIEIKMRDQLDYLPKKTSIRYEDPFNLLDCFKVNMPGTNTLTVSATLYKRHSDDEIILPPVSMRVPITQADLDNYRASKK